MFNESEFLQRGLQYVESSADIRNALANIVRSAIETFGSDSGSLYLLNSGTGELEPYILINFDPEYLKSCSTVPLGKQCCGRAALHKTPWVVRDMLTDPLFADCAQAAAASGFRSGFSIPVLAENGECLGALGCQYRTPYEPSQQNLHFGSLFARLIAAALALQSTRGALLHLRSEEIASSGTFAAD